MHRVHVQRGTGTIRAHLERQYGVRVRAVTSLDVGVHRIDRDDGPSWVARVFHDDRPIERTRSDAALLAQVAAADVPSERLACADPVSMLDGSSVLVTSWV